MSKRLCKHYLNCPFYNKYSTEDHRKDKISIFRQYVEKYCFGENYQECHRYIQKEETGTMPADDITPTGERYKPEK